MEFIQVVNCIIQIVKKKVFVYLFEVKQLRLSINKFCDL